MREINIPNTKEQYGSFKLIEVKGNYKMFMGLNSDVTLLPSKLPTV